jgi:hypothetical protein
MAKRRMKDREDRFFQVITNVIQAITMETTNLVFLEEFFSPKPSTLAGEGKDAAVKLQKRCSSVIQSFGGQPERVLIIRASDGSDDGKTEHFDAYPGAAMSEMVSLFHRTRRSVCRCQMLLVGNGFLKDNPDLLNEALPSDIRKSVFDMLDEQFWEQAETAYIRIASYWDRVGQMLDFVFFNIRQFERDGFTAVIDRIHTNFVPLDKHLAELQEWKDLRAFQTSDREDGLKWLLRRRNLLVHSLYLRPFEERNIETDSSWAPLFSFEFNHLEKRIKDKLKPGSSAQEVERLNIQLARAADLFPSVLRLCEYAADRLSRR